MYEPGAIRAAVAAFACFPDAAVIYGHARFIGARGEDLGPYPVVAPFDWRGLADRCHICQPSAFIRRQPLLEAGLLDPRFQHCMDYELWIRMGKGFEIRPLDAQLARSRMYPETKTLGARRQMFTEVFRALKQHYGYVPLSWCYAYAEFLRHGRDQFFTPPVIDGPVRALGRLLFLRHNLTRPHYIPSTVREELSATKSRRAKPGNG